MSNAPTGLYAWPQILEAATKANERYGSCMPQLWVDYLNAALREIPSRPERPTADYDDGFVAGRATLERQMARLTADLAESEDHCKALFDNLDLATAKLRGEEAIRNAALERAAALQTRVEELESAVRAVADQAGAKICALEAELKRLSEGVSRT